MTLRKYSDDEKKILADVVRVRDELMGGMGVKSAKDLTLEQIESITAQVIAKIPEFAEVSRKDLEAFMTAKSIEINGGSRRV